MGFLHVTSPTLTTWQEGASSAFPFVALTQSFYHSLQNSKPFSVFSFPKLGFFVSFFVTRYSDRTIDHTRKFSAEYSCQRLWTAGGFGSSLRRLQSEAGGLGSRMAMRHNFSALLAVVCLLATCLAGAQATMGIVGGLRPISNFANSVEIDELANFAVDQYKTRPNSIADISFSKVLSAKEQVVQGTMYYLTIEVMEGGVAKQYDAKVWVKPWEGYKELESFSPSAPSHYDPAVDVSVKLGESHE